MSNLSKSYLHIDGTTCISADFASITDMYDEWYGRNSFAYKPIEGGFARLEKLRRSKWRCGYSQAEKIRFGKIKRIIAAIDESITGTKTLNHILQEFEHYWWQSGRKPSNMVGLLQQKDLMQKSCRRKRAHDNQVSEEFPVPLQHPFRQEFAFPIQHPFRYE